MTPAGRLLCAALALGAHLALAGPLVRAGRGKARPAARPTATRPSPPAAAPWQVTRSEPFGRVLSVTAEAAFVDRGAADGLAPGQTLSFSRAGKPAGVCTVESVSDHYARCDGGGLRPGDRFAAQRAPALAQVKAPRDPLPSDAELARRGSVIEAQPWTLRDFDGAHAPEAGRGGPRAELLLSHTTMGTVGAGGGPYSIQRLDAAVHDFELWRGLRVSADVTALNFSGRPPDSRTVYQQTPVLLVRQLELGFRRADVPFSASVGRTWLRSTPGLLVVDGGQAAFRFGEAVEVGAYGGLLPEAARLTIVPSQWTVGGFGRVRALFGKGAAATQLQLAVRGGWAQRDFLGGRVELGLMASLWKGPLFDVHAAAELGYGQTQAPGGLDALRLDGGWRPLEGLRVSGALRYRGLPLSGLTEVGTVSPGAQALHADLGVSWAATSWLLVGGQAGLASDLQFGLTQGRVGPELSVPRVFGLPLGASLGYVEEFGWLRGRHGWLQLSVAPSARFRLVTRGSWFHQQATTDSAGIGSHEVGASMALEVSPWSFLRARLLVMGRVPLQPKTPVLGSLGVQVGGAL